MTLESVQQLQTYIFEVFEVDIKEEKLRKILRQEHKLSYRVVRSQAININSPINRALR